MNNKKIGVFDSGIGGLFVLDKLINKYKYESFIYLKDHKNFPYGNKNKNQLIKIVKNNLDLFESLNVKMVIAACNTASSVIKYIDKKYDFIIVNIIDVVCEYLLSNFKINKLLIICTKLTKESYAYQQLLNDKINFDIIDVQEFVEICENCNTTYEEIKSIILMKNIDVNKYDYILEACTHFEILEVFLKNIFLNSNFINCGDAVSEYLKKFLFEIKKEDSSNCDDNIIYLST